LFGSQYAMPHLARPAKLNNYGLTPVDVSNAIQAQNVQIPRELGGLPSVKDSKLNATSSVRTRLHTPRSSAPSC